MGQLSLGWDKRQNDMRRVRSAVVNCLIRRRDCRVHRLFVAGVGVAVPHGEVAAGDMDPNPMPLQEDIAGRHQVDGVLVDLPRPQQLGRFPDRLPEPGADNALGQIVGRPGQVTLVRSRTPSRMGTMISCRVIFAFLLTLACATLRSAGRRL